MKKRGYKQNQIVNHIKNIKFSGKKEALTTKQNKKVLYIVLWNSEGPLWIVNTPPSHTHTHTFASISFWSLNLLVQTLQLGNSQIMSNILEDVVRVVYTLQSAAT